MEDFVFKSWMLIGQSRNLLEADWCILNFRTDCWAAGSRLRNQDWRILFWRAGFWLDRTGISWILIGIFWISAQTAWVAGTRLRNQDWMLIGQNQNLLDTDWCILNFNRLPGQLEPDSRIRTEGFAFKSWILIGKNRNLLDTDWCILNFSTGCLGSWTRLRNQDWRICFKSWMLIGQNRNLLDTDWCILNFSADCLGSWSQTLEPYWRILFLIAEPVFFYVFGAQESIPRHQFRQPM